MFLSVADYLNTEEAKQLLSKPENICPEVGERLKFYLNGKVVQESKNSRGLISRANKVGVFAISLFRTQYGSYGDWENFVETGAVFVEYLDGSTVRIRFADHNIAKAFFRKRYRRWKLNHESRNSDNYTIWHGRS